MNLKFRQCSRLPFLGLWAHRWMYHWACNT